MRFDRSVKLPLTVVVVGLVWASSSRADSASDQALKVKGLTKTGTVYVIEDEKPVLAKWKEARAAFASFAAMSDQQLTAQQLSQRASELQEQHAQLQSQLEDLNLRIGDQGMARGNGGGPGQGAGGGFGGIGGLGSFGTQSNFQSPLVAERNQIRQALNEVAAEQKTVKNQSPQAKDVTAIDSRVTKAEEAFKKSLADLRTEVDTVKKKYSELDADEAVKKSLAEAKKGNSKLRLGPSDAFLAGSKELEKAEQRFLGKKTSVVSKKKSKSKK